MKPILILLVLFSVLQACTSASEKEDTTTKPNILWIVADDLGTDLGCYGTPQVYTPHLDQLASEGVRYENLFTVAAVCSASRSGLITGMYPQSINCHQHRTQYKDSLPDPVIPITHYFREAGYFVSNGVYNDREKPGKQDYNFLADSLYDGTDWSQRQPGQPFFAQIQIFFPHRPFKRDPSHPVDPDSVEIPPVYPDHPITRQDWALYLEYIQLLDQEVGKLLQRLEEEGLADNTVVFFFGDQGQPHVRAKQFMYDDGINTPLIIRWKEKLEAGTVSDQMISNIDLGPTAMRIAGIEMPAYMQGRDIFGENKREYIFAGRDRRDETVDRIRAVRSQAFKYIRNFYTERPYTQFNAYKKQAYPVLTLMQVMHKNEELTPEQALFMADTKPEEELYNVAKDPEEIHNLAHDPEYTEVLQEMHAQLDQWLAEADRGQYPEDPEEIEYAEQLMKGVFKDRMEEKGLSVTSTDEEILEYWTHYLVPTQKDVHEYPALVQ
jgi:uncharacterized sulfatase